LMDSTDAAPTALTTATATTGNPGADGCTAGALHWTDCVRRTCRPLHTLPPISTMGGARVASIMPLPVTTTGSPGAAIEVGVMEVNTGRVASETHASHATSDAARLAHTALAFSSTVGL